MGDMHLEAQVDGVKLSFAERYRGTLVCTATLGNRPLSKVPIIWRYNRGTLPKSDSGKTNPSGEITIGLSQFEPGTRNSELKIELDLEHLAPRIAESSAKDLLQHLPVPSLSIPIQLTPPTIYFNTNEKQKGELRDQQLLLNSIAEGLSNQGVTWVQRKAGSGPHPHIGIRYPGQRIRLGILHRISQCYSGPKNTRRHSDSSAKLE
jgi:hypothetical protein